MRPHEYLAWCLTAALLATVGCSDSHPGRTGRGHVGSLDCGSGACGGDIVGSWTIAGACVERTGEMLSDECEGADVDISGLSLEGSFTFDEDGTGHNETEAAVDFRFHIPDECLMGASCDRLEMALNDEDDPESTVFSCSSGGGGCNCDGLVESTDTETFGWEQSGDQLMVDSDDTPWDYCVDGDAAMVRREGEGFEFSILLERS